MNKQIALMSQQHQSSMNLVQTQMDYNSKISTLQTEVKVTELKGDNKVLEVKLNHAEEEAKKSK